MQLLLFVSVLLHLYPWTLRLGVRADVLYLQRKLMCISREVRIQSSTKLLKNCIPELLCTFFTMSNINEYLCHHVITLGSHLKNTEPYGFVLIFLVLKWLLFDREALSHSENWQMITMHSCLSKWGTHINPFANIQISFSYFYGIFARIMRLADEICTRDIPRNFGWNCSSFTDLTSQPIFLCYPKKTNWTILANGLC